MSEDDAQGSIFNQSAGKLLFVETTKRSLLQQRHADNQRDM